jgi:hypothetical protein
MNTYLMSYRLDGIYYASKRQAASVAKAEAATRRNLAGRPEKVTAIRARRFSH